MKEKVFIETFRLVSKYGIRVMNMDNLAKEMGVSKKTIYQYYSNKDELVVDCVAYIIAGLNEKLEEVIAGSDNPLIKICRMYSYCLDVILELPQVFFYDLRKYHPEANALLMNFRKEILFVNVVRLLEEAKSQDLLVENVNIGFVCKIHFFRILELVQDLSIRVDPDFGHDELLSSLIVGNLRGILRSGHMHILDNYKRGNKRPGL